MAELDDGSGGKAKVFLAFFRGPAFDDEARLGAVSVFDLCDVETLLSQEANSGWWDWSRNVRTKHEMFIGKRGDPAGMSEGYSRDLEGLVEFIAYNNHIALFAEDADDFATGSERAKELIERPSLTVAAYVESLEEAEEAANRAELLGELEDLVPIDREVLLRALTEVFGQHYQEAGVRPANCKACQEPWPCSHRRVLSEVLDAKLGLQITGLEVEPIEVSPFDYGIRPFPPPGAPRH